MLTANDFLVELRSRGALRLSRVTFRNNRNTVWSLTRGGTVLNVHAAYRAATPLLLDAFAALAKEGGIGSAPTRRAAHVVSEWPALASAMQEARASHLARNRHDLDGGVTHCCATRPQREYLRRVYRYFNLTRFGGALPDDVPVRLSSRMKSALGHMLPGTSEDGERQIAEIALNVDLMLPGNGPERIDTILHEMAHVADYLATGSRGHGRSWKEWARRSGCQPTTLYERPVRFRKHRRVPVERVPPLPPGLLGSA